VVLAVCIVSSCSVVRGDPTLGRRLGRTTSELISARLHEPLDELERLVADLAPAADFDRWSKRLVKALGKENVTQTIEALHKLKRVLDSDAKHFEAATER
jgi:hypothetical protein